MMQQTLPKPSVTPLMLLRRLAERRSRLFGASRSSWSSARKDPMTDTQVQRHDLVDVLRRYGALLIGDSDDQFELKSGERSRYFVDFGTIPDGDALTELGECYADKILEEFDADSFDLVFGPAYKAIPIAVSTAIALKGHGFNKQYAFDRKIEKTYGEKSRFIGGKLESGVRVLILDDVITSGGTKLDTIQTLNAIPGVEVVGVIVGVDRTSDPEIVTNFQEQTGLPLKAICTIDEIDARLRAAPPPAPAAAV